MSSRTSEPGRSAPFFDHGLFLLHLNRGKEDLRKGLYDDARREFEEARRFRATDPEVLSNLALAMFHLGHLDDAERITRGLLVSHADSVPLLFNLGLILFKAGRAEAREPLERVLALAPGHRKAHLTVGLLLQREGRLAEANRHFEAAGSERKAGFDGDDTITRTARSAASGPAEPGAFVPSVKPEAFDDSRARREPSTQPIQAPQPPPEAPRAAPVPPAVAPVAPPVPARTPVGVPEATPGPRPTFTPRPGGVVAVDLRDGVLVRRTALAGRTGVAELEADGSLPGALSRFFVRGTGAGGVLLVDPRRSLHLVFLRGEFLSADPARLFGFDARLTYREDPAFEFRRQIALPFLKLFGSGAVAFSVAAEPARLEVSSETPLTLSCRSLLAYGGELTVDLVEDSDPLAELGGGPVVTVSGAGWVLIEA
ncbi:MAG TPA: tetratricopeptide repeat protein [Thermoanaerobaculia bacterium]|mgnify:CR=1 FL=1|nr:tetratricopeptide repeat protein [Thermoanaerobaculia bacterium]